MSVTKRDILELRRRLTKKACTFTRLAGCYVSSEQQILLQFHETFADLAEDEYFKYLEISKKVLSGTLGNNLLDLELDRTEQAAARQQFLLSVKSSKLKDEALLSQFFQEIISCYAHTSNYLILVFHDVYDIITRTTDRLKLDESEEVYEYMLCALCPVELSKPALGYREDENRIGACERDWIVSMPEIGFVFPAFREGSSDTNAVLYYTKNSAEIHPELITEILGCQNCRTATQSKQIFQAIVEQAFGAEAEQAENTFLKMQHNLAGIVETQEQDTTLSAERVADIMDDIEIPDTVREKIEQTYAREFSDTLPDAAHLLDHKLAQEGAVRAHTMHLQQKIDTLQQQLAQKEATLSPASALCIQLPEARAITTQVIDGKNYLLVPLEENETPMINGQPWTAPTENA